MKNKLSYIFIIFTILIHTLSAATIELTNQEKKFLKAHPNIVLGTDASWMPYVVINKNENITGYDQDVLNRINQLTGANFQIKVAKWSEVVVEAKNKIIDGLSTSSIQASKRKYLNFSKPYVKIKYIFLTSNSKNNTSLKNIDDIDGHTIGIQKGNLASKRIIKRFKNSKIIEYSNYIEIIKAVVTEKIDIMIMGDSLSIFHIANESKIPFLRPIAMLDKEVDLVFSIRKDYPEAINIINKALAYIGEKELEKIKNKWFKSSLYPSQKKLYLKQEELTYLKTKKEITMCIDPNWMPLEKIVHDQAIGFTSDFMKLIADKINTPINLVATNTWTESLKNIEHKACDIIPMVAHTPKLNKHMDFTSPYLSLQVVLATKSSTIYINSLENELEKKFAVVKNYALYSYLKSKYPTLKIVNVNSLHDGLKKVSKGEVFGYIDNSAVITHEIQTNFFSTIAITGKVDFKMHYSVGTRNDEKILNSIFEKAIFSIENSDKEDIKNRWFKFRQDAMIDYNLIRNIIVSFLFISLIGSSFLMILKRKNQKLKIAQKQIEEFNVTLEKQVKKEIEKNKQQQLMILQQSRLAQMGEAINMIAHQWRQPLNVLNGLVMTMDIKLSKESCNNKALLEKEFTEIEQTTQYMSHTINDFRDFFKPHKEKIEFYLHESIEDAIRLLQPILLHSEIKVYQENKENIKILGYPNEIGQVIINIINNAKDALISNNTNMKKEIHINLFQKNKTIQLVIEDNAGGINEEIIHYIFDPYFSTKGEKEGTGLGLYISKMIIEKHMEGKLNVKNTSKGAKFTIEFNLL